MNILILGSQGFIGGHIADFFEQKEFTVYGCDLIEAPHSKYKYFKAYPSPTSWDELFMNNHFDYCVNAAGSGDVSYSVSHPFEDFGSNTLDTMRLLDAIRKFRPQCKYIHISSAAVYGNPGKLPVCESDPCQPISPYGYHKWMSELICREYHHLFGIPVAIMRPFSVYGERQRKQLLWDTCKKLAAADEIRLFGTGLESRDFIHVRDLARLIGYIIENSNFDATVYNAASGIETTIREIADLFMQCYNGKKNIIFSGERRAGDPLNWRADITKSLQTGFKPEITLQQGIAQYKIWFEQHGF